MTDCDQEIAKKDEYPVEFDEKANQWPTEEDQSNSCGEGGGAFELLTTGEEGNRFLDSDDKGEADEEEDLHLR